MWSFAAIHLNSLADFTQQLQPYNKKIQNPNCLEIDPNYQEFISDLEQNCLKDLGNYQDDYVGCDVGLGLGYCYNGDAEDDGAFRYRARAVFER